MGCKKAQVFSLKSCVNKFLFKKFSEHFSIECRKTKAKAISTANQKKAKYHKEPMRAQRKTRWPKARENNQLSREWMIWLYQLN